MAADSIPTLLATLAGCDALQTRSVAATKKLHETLLRASSAAAEPPPHSAFALYADRVSELRSARRFAAADALEALFFHARALDVPDAVLSLLFSLAGGVESAGRQPALAKGALARILAAAPGADDAFYKLRTPISGQTYHWDEVPAPQDSSGFVPLKLWSSTMYVWWSALLEGR